MTAEELQTLRGRLSNRLNDHLCEMKPDYDDSIVGFNEAWNVVRKFFDDEAKRASMTEDEARQANGGAWSKSEQLAKESGMPISLKDVIYSEDAARATSPDQGGR